MIDDLLAPGQEIAKRLEEYGIGVHAIKTLQELHEYKAQDESWVAVFVIYRGYAINEAAGRMANIRCKWECIVVEHNAEGELNAGKVVINILKALTGYCPPSGGQFQPAESPATDGEIGTGYYRLGFNIDLPICGG
jgi:hypothetical protein